MSTPQSGKVKAAILKCISEKGMTDKKKIYTQVVEDLGVPRPTVRRVAGMLRNELSKEISQLEEDLRKSKANLETIS